MPSHWHSCQAFPCLLCSHHQPLRLDALCVYFGDKHPLLSWKKAELSYTLRKSLPGSFFEAEMERAEVLWSKPHWDILGFWYSNMKNTVEPFSERRLCLTCLTCSSVTKSLNLEKCLCSAKSNRLTCVSKLLQKGKHNGKAQAVARLECVWECVLWEVGKWNAGLKCVCLVLAWLFKYI